MLLYAKYETEAFSFAVERETVLFSLSDTRLPYLIFAIEFKFVKGLVKKNLPAYPCCYI